MRTPFHACTFAIFCASGDNLCLRVWFYRDPVAVSVSASARPVSVAFSRTNAHSCAGDAASSYGYSYTVVFGKISGSYTPVSALAATASSCGAITGGTGVAASATNLDTAGLDLPYTATIAQMETEVRMCALVCAYACVCVCASAHRIARLTAWGLLFPPFAVGEAAHCRLHECAGVTARCQRRPRVDDHAPRAARLLLRIHLLAQHPLHQRWRCDASEFCCFCAVFSQCLHLNRRRVRCQRAYQRQHAGWQLPALAQRRGLCQLNILLLHPFTSFSPFHLLLTLSSGQLHAHPVQCWQWCCSDSSGVDSRSRRQRCRNSLWPGLRGRLHLDCHLPDVPRRCAAAGRHQPPHRLGCKHHGV